MNQDNKQDKTKNPDGCAEDFRSGLYLVATPIGNLRDITLRALDVLRGADCIVCEDTRHTRKLLHAHGIRAKLQSCYDHSGDSRRAEIVAQVKAGDMVALVSDAGMPLICDPGYKLVRDCMADGLYITTIPGASAPLAALQLSGLPCDAFSFIGFLPAKTGARQAALKKWADAPGTLIALETAPRLMGCLQDIAYIMGARQVAVVREITKLYEEVRKDTPVALFSYYKTHGIPKGEIVLVITPPDEKKLSRDHLVDMIRNALDRMSVNDAAKYVSSETGLKKSDIYAMALEINGEDA